MATDHFTLNGILVDATAELRERWKSYRDDFGPRNDEPHDVIQEIADAAVPVYTSDLLRLAAESNDLATATPEVGPAFDGAPTPVNIIAANVFEAIEVGLWEEWQRIESEAKSLGETIAHAECEGYERGLAAGSWVVDGNTSEATARRLLEGIEDGDPEILDGLPSAPLSGEFADDLTPRDVLDWYELGEDDDGADDVLAAFEEGFARGVIDEVTRSARAILGER